MGAGNGGCDTSHGYGSNVVIEHTDNESFMEEIKGLSIVGGRCGEDGFHFELSDGRYLIIAGDFVMGVCRVGEAIH